MISLIDRANGSVLMLSMRNRIISLLLRRKILNMARIHGKYIGCSALIGLMLLIGWNGII
jgi:hypothetical protein